MLLLPFFIYASLSLTNCCDGKSTKPNTNKHATKKTLKNKNGKRWMSTGAYTQQFMNSEPEQTYSSQFAPDNAFSPSSEVPYAFAGGVTNYKDPSFQGMAELKIPKQAYGTAESSYAQDLAAYLKPGIGDYPSDMPAGMKGFEGGNGINSNGVGLPYASRFSKGKNLNPVASLVQSALDESSGTHGGMHKQTGSESAPVGFEAASILSDAMNSDDVTPAKVLEASSAAIDSLSSLSEAASTSKANNKVSGLDDVKVHGKKEGDIDGEKVAGKIMKDKDAAEHAKNGKDKESSKAVESSESKKVGHNTLKASKHKTETGARRQNWDGFIDTGNNHIEPVGLPSLKPLNMFSDSDEKTGETEGTSRTSADTSASDSDTTTTPSGVKAKLVSSLRAALLKNVQELMNNDNDSDDQEESASKASVSTSTSEVLQDKEESLSDQKETQAVDDSKASDLLEDNLMKIDKKKLVHLLASLINKNREVEVDDEDTKVKDMEKEHMFQQSSDFLSNKMNHHQKGHKYAANDPYAQIGLTDPTNSDTTNDPINNGRHSVHESHDKNEKEATASKEEEKGKKFEKEEDSKEATEETKEKESSKSKEAKESSKVKNDNEEKVKETEKVKDKEDDNTKEKVKANEKVKENEDDKEDENTEEKVKANEKVKEREDDKEDGEKIKEIEDQKEKESSKQESSKEEEKEKEKQDVKEEEKNVEAEVEKERQELKKLKEEEKAEKAKESELKASNAELEEKQKQKQESSEESSENNEKPVKVQHGQYVHLISPDLLTAISENLKNGKGLNQESEEKESQTTTDESQGEKEKENSKEDSKESLKEKEEEGPSIQSLIENMKAKLLSKTKNKNKSKASKHKKGMFDDAYAQIGSIDPDIKRRGREKKHHVRHPHNISRNKKKTAV